MTSTRLSLLGVAALLGSALLGHSQDDLYAFLRFHNESQKPVTVKIWNPRAGGARLEATVDAGKSADVPGTDGKPARIGLYSSQIQVNGQEAKSVIRVANRQEDRYVVLWSEGGFKLPK